MQTVGYEEAHFPPPSGGGGGGGGPPFDKQAKPRTGWSSIPFDPPVEAEEPLAGPGRHHAGNSRVGGRRIHRERND
jgi:hypothetical protein